MPQPWADCTVCPHLLAEHRSRGCTVAGCRCDREKPVMFSRQKVVAKFGTPDRDLIAEAKYLSQSPDGQLLSMRWERAGDATLIVALSIDPDWDGLWQVIEVTDLRPHAEPAWAIRSDV